MLLHPERIPITCPIWHSPLLYIVAGAIEIRCGSCRGLLHRTSREEIELHWKRLDEQRAAAQEKEPPSHD